MTTITNKSNDLKNIEAGGITVSLNPGASVELDIDPTEAKRVSREYGVCVYIPTRRVND